MALQITISNSDPNPNGDAARMSKSSNNYPNDANWRALDKDYQVSLPAAVWSAPAGSQLSFTVTQGNTSATYTLKSGAPTGPQGYTISPDPFRTGPPSVIVDP